MMKLASFFNQVFVFMKAMNDESKNGTENDRVPFTLKQSKITPISFIETM